MMRGLQFREDRISEKATRSLAKIAAGLVLVSSIGCSSRPLIPNTRSSSYYSTPTRVRDMHHHLDDPSAATITVQGMEVKVIDLVLPMESMLRRSRTGRVNGNNAFITETVRDSVVEESGAAHPGTSYSAALRSSVERYITRRDGERETRVIEISGIAYIFQAFEADDGSVRTCSFGFGVRGTGGDISSRHQFRAEEFATFVQVSSGQPLRAVMIIEQGAFGRYSAFAMPLTQSGQPMGRVAEGQLVFGITYDHQRGEAIGGMVVLRDP